MKNNTVLLSPFKYLGGVEITNKLFNEVTRKIAFIDAKYVVEAIGLNADGALVAFLNLPTGFDKDLLSNDFKKGNHTWNRSAFYPFALYMDSAAFYDESLPTVEASSFWYVECLKAVRSGNFSTIERVILDVDMPVDFGFNVCQAFANLEQLVSLFDNGEVQTDQFLIKFKQLNSKPSLCVTRKT